MWHPSLQCSECGEHLPRARRPVNPGLAPFHLNFTAFGELGTIMGPVFGYQIPCGPESGLGSPCPRNSAVGGEMGGSYIILPMAWGSLGFWGAAVDSVFQGQQNAFPLPFPLGAWDEGDRHTQPPLLRS